MKTENEVLTKIQELEKQNQQLTHKDKKIINQNIINQEDMGKMMENENQLKVNHTILEALKWVVGSKEEVMDY